MARLNAVNPIIKRQLQVNTMAPSHASDTAEVIFSTRTSLMVPCAFQHLEPKGQWSLELNVSFSLWLVHQWCNVHPLQPLESMGWIWYNSSIFPTEHMIAWSLELLARRKTMGLNVDARAVTALKTLGSSRSWMQQSTYLLTIYPINGNRQLNPFGILNSRAWFSHGAWRFSRNFYVVKFVYRRVSGDGGAMMTVSLVVPFKVRVFLLVASAFWFRDNFDVSNVVFVRT